MTPIPGDDAPLELWGGMECTVNRVRDTYFDQIERTGHATRLDDLDRFAGLGIRALRYPILWERTAPDGLEHADWSWADERLGRLRELGIRPIVGLVHHGSGPRHTSLVDPRFPEGLAAFARAVAERYPWVEDFTPVNEPLTTARFSGMYGHWYPHGRTPETFARCLLTQCRAVVLAMRAIRSVNPHARLVQTDDLGKVHSTPALAYQGDFENERRWLTFDLLCGRVNSGHAIWKYLRNANVSEAELGWLLEHPCPPDIIGLNHYLSSERFLDERLERYPPDSHGGNGRQRYADVLAARVRTQGPDGPRRLFAEAWERYRLPIAITEAHNGCTREEQLRWLLEVWQAAQSLRGEGVGIRAVTLWSLLGAYDWDSLVTADRGRYEPGVFDLRGPSPRPTALAALARGLGRSEAEDERARQSSTAGCENSPAAQDRASPSATSVAASALDRGHAAAPATILDHPLLAEPGWWRRPERLHFPPVDQDGVDVPASAIPCETAGRRRHPLAITGARGTLGRAVARICGGRGIPYRLLTRQELDIADPASVSRLLDDLRPWAIVNTAGYVRVDLAESEPERCRRENAVGPALLAAACAERGVALLSFSSDLVFDGAKAAPYVESDGVCPLNVYGRTKAEAEMRVLAADPAALIVRTSAFFGPWDQYNFVTIALRELAAGRPFIAADDAVVSPTYVPDLVQTSLDLLTDGERGIWHLANPGAATWLDLARSAAVLAGVNGATLEPRSTDALGLAAPRPLYSVLGSERGVLLPPLDDALARYIAERDAEPAAT